MAVTPVSAIRTTTPALACESGLMAIIARVIAEVAAAACGSKTTEMTPKYKAQYFTIATSLHWSHGIDAGADEAIGAFVGAE